MSWHSSDNHRNFQSQITDIPYLVSLVMASTVILNLDMEKHIETSVAELSIAVTPPPTDEVFFSAAEPHPAESRSPFSLLCPVYESSLTTHSTASQRHFTTQYPPSRAQTLDPHTPRSCILRLPRCHLLSLLRPASPSSQARPASNTCRATVPGFATASLPG